MLGVDRTGGIERTSEWIDDAADELVPDWNLEHATRAPDLVPFLELEIVAQHDRADVVFFEIESEGGDFLAGFGGGHLEHLTGHRLLKSVDASDSVLDLEDGADVLDIELVEVRRLDLAEEYVLDFAGTKDRISGHDLSLRSWVGGCPENPFGGGISLLVKFITSSFLVQRQTFWKSRAAKSWTRDSGAVSGIHNPETGL